ncbi:MAG: O-antigen ligase family protein, partial [Candidatus Komeilibacteria bacterium]|nr:O-antigen ligase family protein [Candidatus Komeilibacteria bacterium]
FAPLLQIRFRGLVAPGGEAIRLEEVSRSERLGEYGDALKLLPDYFLTGTGLGAYAKRLEQIKPGLPGYAYQPAHNFYLLLALELGIPALFLFLGMLIVFFFAMCRGRHWTAVPPFVTLLILGFFDHYLWSLEAGVMLFWTALGLLYNFKDEEI